MAEEAPRDDREELIQLYQDLADHTLEACKAECPDFGSCCDAFYCEVAQTYALDKWGVRLEPTGHPTLPLMGPKGCTAPPHLRPICTVHFCEMERVERQPDRSRWKERYLQLRRRIDDLGRLR